MNNTPFYVGQKVVCIQGSEYLKKGNDYVVSDLFFTKCCKRWYVSVGIVNVSKKPPVCPLCENPVNAHNKDGFIFHNASWFRAIEENTYEDVTKELAVLPTDEVPDIKKIKELVN